MTAIRVIFDGKAFIPQQAISLPDQCEALVFVDQADPSIQAQLDSAIRAYYQETTGPDEGDDEDTAWGNATAPESCRAWDED